MSKSDRDEREIGNIEPTLVPGKFNILRRSFIAAVAVAAGAVDRSDHPLTVEQLFCELSDVQKQRGRLYDVLPAGAGTVLKDLESDPKRTLGRVSISKIIHSDINTTSCAKIIDVGSVVITRISKFVLEHGKMPTTQSKHKDGRWVAITGCKVVLPPEKVISTVGAIGPQSTFCVVGPAGPESTQRMVSRNLLASALAFSGPAGANGNHYVVEPKNQP